MTPRYEMFSNSMASRLITYFPARAFLRLMFLSATSVTSWPSTLRTSRAAVVWGRQNPAVYLRNLRTYAGTAGTLTKQPGSGHFESTPTVWVIQNGKPALADQARVNEEVRP